jgi:hypothetical protein
MQYLGLVERDGERGALLVHPDAKKFSASAAGLKDQPLPREEFCNESMLAAKIAIAKAMGKTEAYDKLTQIYDHLVEVNAGPGAKPTTAPAIDMTR